MAAKKTVQVETADDDDDEDCTDADTERSIQDLTDEVMETFAPEHPVMVDTHNICELVSLSKLGKLPIKTLQHFCNSLEIDVSTFSGTRKQPFIEVLEGFVGRCNECKGNK